MIQKMPMSSGGGGKSIALPLRSASDTNASFALSSGSGGLFHFDVWNSTSNANTLYFYVDVTSIKKVTVDLTVSTIPYGFTGQKLAIASTQPNTSVTETIVKSVPIERTTGNARYELDLTGYSGMYYVEIGVTALRGDINSIEIELT